MSVKPETSNERTVDRIADCPKCGGWSCSHIWERDAPTFPAQGSQLKSLREVQSEREALEVA